MPLEAIIAGVKSANITMKIHVIHPRTEAAQLIPLATCQVTTDSLKASMDEQLEVEPLKQFVRH